MITKVMEVAPLFTAIMRLDRDAVSNKSCNQGAKQWHTKNLPKPLISTNHTTLFSSNPLEGRRHSR